MSSKNLQQRLIDMLDRIEEIESFVKGRSEEDLLSDTMLLRAVERNLEIVGEIVRYIPDDVRNKYSDIEWSQIFGMRNIIAHGYDGLSEETMWISIHEDFPRLKATLKIMMEEGEP